MQGRGDRLRVARYQVLTFLQGFLPLPATATQIAIGIVIGADYQLNHRLPEHTALSVEVAPDLLPVIMGGKIVMRPSML